MRRLIRSVSARTLWFLYCRYHSKNRWLIRRPSRDESEYTCRILTKVKYIYYEKDGNSDLAVTFGWLWAFRFYLHIAFEEVLPTPLSLVVSEYQKCHHYILFLTLIYISPTPLSLFSGLPLGGNFSCPSFTHWCLHSACPYLWYTWMEAIQ